MRIGDAAAAVGTTARALRFYEQCGLLSPPRTATGQREYGTGEISRLRIIRELLSLGLTIEDLRNCAARLDLLEGDVLSPFGDPEGGCAQPSGIAERRLSALDAEITRLTRLRDRLAARVAPTDVVSR